MKKEQLWFLIGGFAFGVLVGFGVFKAVESQPGLDDSPPSRQMASPAGPRAPGGGGPPPGGGGGGAPMVGRINELKRRLEANPDDFVAATTLANMYYDVSMWDQALQFYDLSLTMKPDDPDILTDSGNAFRALGQYDRALERFRRAQEADPAHWQSLFNTVVVAAFDLRRDDLADAAIAKLEGFDPVPEKLPALKRALAEFRAEASHSATP